MACAPVALFAFRRPDHLLRCLTSLAACPEAASTDLVVFCDGPRGPHDAAAVEEVRAIAREAAGFGSVKVVEQPVNRGLAASVIDGVTAVLGDHECVIVVEDDLVVSVDFLRFLNEALDMYGDDEDVVSIHAFSYPTYGELPQTFFLRGADCWGWATWRRGWALFDPDGPGLLARLRASGLEREFDLDGAYPYTALLEDQVEGRVDSWAVRWRASAFLAGRVTLWPGVSLVENIGQDGSGTHSVATSSLAVEAARLAWPLERIPVQESAAARTAIIDTVARDHGAAGGRLRSLARRWKRT